MIQKHSLEILKRVIAELDGELKIGQIVATKNSLLQRIYDILNKKKMDGEMKHFNKPLIALIAHSNIRSNSTSSLGSLLGSFLASSVPKPIGPIIPVESAAEEKLRKEKNKIMDSWGRQRLIVTFSRFKRHLDGEFF